MSLTSYRAAPPRDIRVSEGGMRRSEWVQMTCTHVARASMPGDDLLFHRLSDSTIGAGGFHGRVRNGIGWDTDAIATRQWSRCDMRTRHLNPFTISSTLCSLSGTVAGWSSPVARQAHNLKVTGSNPVPATNQARKVHKTMRALLRL